MSDQWVGAVWLVLERLKSGFARLRAGSRILVLLLLLLVLSGTVSANHAPRTLRVGVYENPPKVFTLPDGEADGIFVDLLKEIATLEGWRLAFIRCEWQACLDLLADGDLDILPDLAHSDERDRRFGFNRIPALHSWSQLYRRPELAIESILDLQGKRIAVLEGSVQASALEAMLRGFDIRFELVLVESLDAALQRVVSGEADATVVNRYFGEFRAGAMGLVETPIVLQPARLYFATGHDRDQLLRDRIDAHLDAWQKDQGSFYYRTLQNWTGEAPRTFIPPGVIRVLLLLAIVAMVLVASVLVLRARVIAKTAELGESNRQLQATLDAVPDLLFELDHQGRYLMVRARQRDKLAAPAGTLPGRMLQEVLPADAARVCLEAIAEARRDGSSTGRTFRLALADGEHWFELSVARKAPVRAGEPTFIMLSRDVTDRHKAEAAVARLSRLYATLSQCNQAIVRSASEAELLPRICKNAVSFGGMKMVWIGMVDRGDRSVRPVAWFGDGTDYLDGLRISIEADDVLGCGPTGIAIREDRPYWCNDFRNDPATAPWHDRASGFGWAASAALPLHCDGRVVGSITLYADETDAFDEAAQGLLLEMAMDIDFALDRFRNDQERAQMAEALVEREEKYRELTESINDVIWTLDPETLRFLYVSPSVFRLRGFTPEEIMAEPLDAALTPEGAIKIRGLIGAHAADFEAGIRSSNDVVVEMVEQPRKDGTTVWTEVVTNMVRNRRTGKVEIRGVTRDISERKRAEAEIQRLAHFDQLTGLPNRSLLKDRFRVAMSLAQRTRQHLAVMFLDLDHFKNINDTLGHNVGDLLLVEVARRLETTLRAGDTLCRLGGDEFIFILPDTGAEGAAQVATKVIAAVSRPYLIEHHELTTTPSIGIAIYPEDGADMETLSRNADAAMYQVKRVSRNDFRFFTREMQAHSARALMLSSALHHALERDQLSLSYQPQVSLQDGRVIGAEALLRWRHPDFGPIAPAEFIRIAEGNGLILPIGAWVMRNALAQARRWMDEGLPPLVMAVNLSAVQFRHPDLPALLDRIIDESGFPPDRVELELTEAVAMDDPETAVRVMDRLAARGVGMAIDDFGTGYSSLSYLKRFKVRKLKIDKSFVRDIPDDPDDKAIVTAIINLAFSLGMQTIAEGVETAGQLDFLRLQGCDEVQGYHFSEPLPADGFADYVRMVEARWGRT